LTSSPVKGSIQPQTPLNTPLLWDKTVISPNLVVGLLQGNFPKLSQGTSKKASGKIDGCGKINGLKRHQLLRSHADLMRLGYGRSPLALGMTGEYG